MASTTTTTAAPTAAPLPAHGNRALEGDVPLAHGHAVVTKLVLLCDGHVDKVDFTDVFTPDARFADPIGTAVGPAAIRRAWEARAGTWKPLAGPHDGGRHAAAAEGGRSRGQGTELLSVQPQGATAARVELKKRYAVRGGALGDGGEFTLDTELFVQLDPATGRVSLLEDKWATALVAWCAELDRDRRRHSSRGGGSGIEAAAAGSAGDAGTAALPGTPGCGGSAHAGSPDALPHWARVLAVARARAGLPVDACWRTTADDDDAAGGNGGGGAGGGTPVNPGGLFDATPTVPAHAEATSGGGVASASTARVAGAVSQAAAALPPNKGSRAGASKTTTPAAALPSGGASPRMDM
jgi:hypothetical protein